MVNKVILVGNLGKDAELRKLDNGNSITSFSVATSENYKDKAGEWQSKTEWHNITFWGERNLAKGEMVYIEGKLQTRKWQDKSGNDRYTTEVVARQIKKLSKNEQREAKPLNTEPIKDSGLPF